LYGGNQVLVLAIELNWIRKFLLSITCVCLLTNFIFVTIFLFAIALHTTRTLLRNAGHLVLEAKSLASPPPGYW